MDIVYHQTYINYTYLRKLKQAAHSCGWSISAEVSITEDSLTGNGWNRAKPKSVYILGATIALAANTENEY